MNAFLFKVGHRDTISPLCPCGLEEQTPYHSIVECKSIDTTIKKELTEVMKNFYYNKETRSVSLGGQDHLTLLNMSRDKHFIDIMLRIIKSKQYMYRTKIVLSRNDPNPPIAENKVSI